MTQTIAILALLISASVSASEKEPAFCEPEAFYRTEIDYGGSQPVRLRLFRLGRVTLAGAAIGASNASDVKKMAMKFTASARHKYCTWYFNDGNPDAARTFNWYDLPMPSGSNYDRMTEKYIDIIGDQFSQAATSFLACAEEENYLSLGCDGMKHRGPTVFAMILAYAGCTPHHATEIVNHYWGQNGISPRMRDEMGQAAARLAAKNPGEAARLRELFETQ